MNFTDSKKAVSLQATSQFLSAVAVAISSGDADAARALLKEIGPGDPADPALTEAAAKCKAVVNRSQWLDSALLAVRSDLEEDRFASAIGHFRQALGVSRGLPSLAAKANEQAELHADELLPRNWRVAEAILLEISSMDPPASVDPDLLEKLKQAKLDESITSAIYKAERLEAEGKIVEARQTLQDLLAAHPKDERISQKIRALDHPPAAATLPIIPASAANGAPGLSANYSELDTEGTLTHPSPAVVQKPWRTRIRISNSSWDTVKNFLTVMSATIMMGTAGLLIWQHYTLGHRRYVHAQFVGQGTVTKPVVTHGSGIFQDVPAAPSEQDSILAAVRSYSSNSRRNLGANVVDEIAVKGNEASVRYRPKDKDGGPAITFSLLRQSGTWQVKNVR